MATETLTPEESKADLATGRNFDDAGLKAEFEAWFASLQSLTMRKLVPEHYVSRWFDGYSQQEALDDGAGDFLAVDNDLAKLRAENERLRVALREIKDMKSEPIGDSGFITGPKVHFDACKRIARAALTPPSPEVR